MEGENRIDSVLAYQDALLSEIQPPDMSGVEERIETSEQLLTELGYDLPAMSSRQRIVTTSKALVLPSWEDLCREAVKAVGTDVTIESLFTEEELLENALAVRRLNEEYNQIHRLDKFDVAIAVAAGLLAGAVDILLVGIPQKTPGGLKAGPLSNYIRDAFDKKFPPDEMEKLANSKVSKVPYDAQEDRKSVV